MTTTPPIIPPIRGQLIGFGTGVGIGVGVGAGMGTISPYYY